MKIKRISIACMRVLMTLLMLMPFAFASTSTYYLDTSRLELQVSPESDTTSGMVKVSSNSDHTIRLKVIPKLWKLNPQGVLTYVTPPTEGYNLLDNIRINPEEFDLPAGKSRMVRFLVKTPPGAQPAEYPFQLYFQPTDLLQASKTGNAAGVKPILDVVPIFTTTVYVYQGSPLPDVKVKSFQCGYQPEKGQFPVALSLENNGSKHARLFGNILISPKEGSKTGQPIEVLHMQNSTLIIVFPGTPREVQNQLTAKTISKLPPGAYQMELQLVDERNIQPAIHSICDFTVSAK